MKKICLLVILAVLLFITNLAYGSIDIPTSEVFNILTAGESSKSVWRFIVMESRLPQAVTALLSGMSLAVSGLMLQTAFRNPLADPSIFGISSGAGVGAALVILLFGGSLTAGALSFSGFAAVFAGAFIGAVAVMAVVFMFSLVVKNDIMLLIIGIMIGYLASAAISLLNYFATEEGVKSYVVWGMGNFGGVPMRLLPHYSAVCLFGLFASLLLIKPLNIIQLGESYAENLGINTSRIRNYLLVITGLLTAIVTSFCGPISFIGLAVPHIAKMICRTSDHRIQMPLTMLAGAITALACNLCCTLPSSGSLLPLNAITPVIGAPVVIYVILKRRVN